MSLEYSTIVKTPDKMRIFAIITGLLIGLPLCTYAFFAASSFFARASDSVPRDVSISNINKSAAVIHWTTDKETLSVVEYGLSPDELTLYAPELEAKREHEVDLTLLNPGTTYYFQIKNSDTIYDNAGVPWTFTTKTTDNAEAEQVKGIATRLTPVATKIPLKTPTPKLSTSSCSESTCDAIKAKLGRGCSAKDYVQCISKSGTAGSVSPSLPLSYHYGTPIPSPTPTSILIQSNVCKFNYLQSLNSCAKWTWGESMDVQEVSCQKSFYRYILECKKSDFNSSGGEIGKWAVYSIAQTNYTIDDELLTGVDKVYCRVRAEDKTGNATEWKYNVEPKSCG